MTLQSVYGSKTAARIMAVLDLHSQNGLRQRELHRAIGDANISQVQKALETLERRELVVGERFDNYTVYRVNKASPLYAGIHQIGLVDVGVAEALSSHRDEVMVAAIFGSVAAGTASPESDLDVLIVGSIDEDVAAKALQRVGTRLSRRVDLAVMDYFEYRTRAKKEDGFLINAMTGVVVMGEWPRWT